jgi:hypothetical protein
MFWQPDLCFLIFRIPDDRQVIDNIKIDLLEIGLSAVDWIGLAQDRYSW